MSTGIAKIGDMETAVLAPVVEAVAGDTAIQRAADAAEYAMSIVVTDSHSHAEAEKAILDIAKGKKAIEAHRKPVTQAIDALKAVVMTYVKGITEPLNSADAYLGTQLTRYRSLMAGLADAQRIADEKAARDAVAAGGPPPAMRAAPAAVTMTAPGEAGVSDKWDLAISLEVAHDVPEHLLMLAPGTLAWVKEQMAGGNLELPQKDSASALHRGIRVTWARGIRRGA